MQIYIVPFGVLLTLLVVLVIQVWIIKVVHMQEENAVRMILITVLSLGSLFLLMGDSNEKLTTQVIGLFSSGIGFLFGRSTSKKKET